MGVSILLVGHPDISQAILKTANRIWHNTPPLTDYLDIPFDADTTVMQSAFLQKLDTLDQGDGVLVLCDIAGASPCNITAVQTIHNISRIAGFNLPMLLRAYNYQDRPLAELAELISEGGSRSILQLT